DYWVFDEATQTVSGRRSRHVFSLAQPIEVRLNEARPVTGGLLFGVAEALPGPVRRGKSLRAKPGRAPGATPGKPKHKQKRRR
ncbi:MAG: ribonuclease R, partial [Acidocella sp.]